MTTMDLKPIQTVNFNNKLTSRNRKARKSSFGCLSSPLANKKGVPTQQCNINNLFHQKMTYGPHAKPQDHFPCLEDHQRQDKRKLSYGSQPELENSHEFYYNTGKYSRKSSANYEKGAANLSLASTASESDNASASELSGFKIVHEGKVLHNETEEELDSPYGDCKSRNGVKVEFAYERFASSVLVTGPNVEKISMPTFA